jgi:hypothetical protein
LYPFFAPGSNRFKNGNKSLQPQTTTEISKRSLSTLTLIFLDIFFHNMPTSNFTSPTALKYCHTHFGRFSAKIKHFFQQHDSGLNNTTIILIIIYLHWKNVCAF